ncbi:MAG: pilus assembly protein [bacterium]|nr:pilus assembly protein [bacterium]
MQVFKRLKAQNLIEFVFIFPVLLIVTLVILEVALYWQDVNAVYNLNQEINANIALIEQNNYVMGQECSAASKSLELLQKKDKMITLAGDLKYIKKTTDGQEPFALYQFEGGAVNTEKGTEPMVTLWVDCRSPYEKGVSTQLQFFHKTLIIKAEIPRIDGEPPIIIIPSNIFISSPNVTTIRHY